MVMKKQEVKNLREAKARIEAVLKEEKKVLAPADVKPRNTEQKKNS